MRFKYSKSSSDIKREGSIIYEQEKNLQNSVLKITEKIFTYPLREHCILCESHLEQSDIFHHREIPFKHCNNCGHIQTLHHVDASYEELAMEELGYKGIYPKLEKEEYNSRCKRIYKPKAEWIFDALFGLKIDPQTIKWCDIGCGAGYFIKSLQELGCSDVYGVDIDEHNLNIAEEVLGKDAVFFNDHSFDQTFIECQADIYSAFFVLEHIEDTYKTIKSLKTKPKGTLFAFSVPTFGFITLFESILKNHYPRSLDAMMHTQVYTEESLNYLLESADFEIVSEWVFGQDMMDIQRFLNYNLSQLYSERLYSSSVNKIEDMLDAMQAVIDQSHFSDARHILAIKK